MRPARIDCGPADFDVADDAALVHYECGAVGKALLLVQDPVLLGNRPHEIAEERELNALLFGEGGVGSRTVYADSENLRVGLCEFGDISLICLQLLRSPPREGQDVKCQDDIFPPKIAQLHVFPVRIFEGEVRGFVPNLQGSSL